MAVLCSLVVSYTSLFNERNLSIFGHVHILKYYLTLHEVFISPTLVLLFIKLLAPY